MPEVPTVDNAGHARQRPSEGSPAQHLTNAMSFIRALTAETATTQLTKMTTRSPRWHSHPVHEIPILARAPSA